VTSQPVVWLVYHWDNARGWQRWMVKLVAPRLASALDELVKAMGNESTDPGH
jgi:hypothetical protein